MLATAKAPIGAPGSVRDRPGVEQRVSVLLGPFGQPTDDVEQTRPKFCQTVAGRIALNQPVALKLLQRLREHLLGDTTNTLEQLAVASVPLTESRDNDVRPCVANERKGGASRTISEENVNLAHSA